jgi:uncharacterized protein (DUF58 family)
VRSALVAAALGLVLSLVAAAFAATPLFLPGIALLLLAATASAWVSAAAREVRLARHTASPAVEEDAPVTVTVAVSRGRLPLPGAEVRVWDGGPPAALAGSGSRTVSADVRFPRRGRHALGPATVRISDPLGLQRRTVCSGDAAVLVLPRVEPVRFASPGGAPAILGRTGPGTALEDATEVDSLRPLRPGTPASRIHWPTVARTMTLMERRLVAAGDRRPLVVVDPRRPSSVDALDQVMRAAASLCVHLARGGGCGVLLPGDRRPASLDGRLHGFSELHARLALLGPEDGGPALGGLIGADAVLWVTPATTPAVALAHLRARDRYVVSPSPRPRWPVEFTVAGCTGQRLERATAVRSVT